MLFTSKKPHFEYLHKRWTGKHRRLQGNLFDKHKEFTRHLTVGSLGGLMLLTMPVGGVLPAPHLLAGGSRQIQKQTDNNMVLAEQLKQAMPPEVRSLTADEEKNIEELLTRQFGFPVKAEIGGIRLNRSYGLIGGEQHLYRFPGDNLMKHAETASEWAMFGPAGIAPGLGAWGYFASSETQFHELDIQREKYYLAVQTFLAPGFAENVGRYRDFFKFRKMLAINPKTGQSVVAVIGDAGPAPWTGKHLGGSPEVMHFLGLAEGPRKGPVLYFFIDDPEDKIPLGPIKIENKV